MNAPKLAGAPSVSDSVAGTVPPTLPSVDTGPWHAPPPLWLPRNVFGAPKSLTSALLPEQVSPYTVLPERIGPYAPASRV